MFRGKNTILLVGGSVVPVDEERLILEKIGYNVITVDSDQKALALIDAEMDLDLVMLTSNLGPGSDVDKTARNIYSRGIPVVFLCDSAFKPPLGYVSIDMGSDDLAFILMLQEFFPGHGGRKELCSDKKRLFEALLEQIDDIVVVKDLNLRVVATNQALLKLIGRLSMSDLLGKTDEEIFGLPEDQEPVKSYMADERHAQTLRQGEYILKEEPVIYTDGSIRIFLTKKYPIYDDSGCLIGTGNISRDITDRKLIEEKAQRLLEEKDLILREAHHRIKNNMYTMMSLLSLHAWSLKDADAVYALDDARNRLGAMALLYDKLYRSGSVQSLSIREYLPCLVKEIADTFPKGEGISLNLEIDDLTLPAAMLSSLGILVNELVTNSMKYAFDGRAEGTLSISAKKHEDVLHLRISDDGPGYPDGFNYDDIENSPGFGMKLISMMTHQLKGSITIKNSPGAMVTLGFPLK